MDFCSLLLKSIILWFKFKFVIVSDKDLSHSIIEGFIDVPFLYDFSTSPSEQTIINPTQIDDNWQINNIDPLLFLSNFNAYELRSLARFLLWKLAECSSSLLKLYLEECDQPAIISEEMARTWKTAHRSLHRS